MLVVSRICEIFELQNLVKLCFQINTFYDICLASIDLLTKQQCFYKMPGGILFECCSICNPCNINAFGGTSAGRLYLVVTPNRQSFMREKCYQLLINETQKSCTIFVDRINHMEIRAYSNLVIDNGGNIVCATEKEKGTITRIGLQRPVRANERVSVVVKDRQYCEIVFYRDESELFGLAKIRRSKNSYELEAFNFSTNDQCARSVFC